MNNTIQQALATIMGGGQQAPSALPLPQPQQGQGEQQNPVDMLFNNLLHGAIMNGYQKSMGNPGGEINLGMQSQMHGVHGQAVAQAIQNGADPSLLDQAAQMLNKNQFIGLCEAFVEKMTKGTEGLYASAAQAWNKQPHTEGLSGIKPGDAVYFAPDASNGFDGHTGVYQGNNQFISATYNGIKQYNLSDWQKMTGQKLQGYVSTQNKVVQPKSQTMPQMQNGIKSPYQQLQQQPAIVPQLMKSQKPTFTPVARPTLPIRKAVA